MANDMRNDNAFNLNKNYMIKVQATNDIANAVTEETRELEKEEKKRLDRLQKTFQMEK